MQYLLLPVYTTGLSIRTYMFGVHFPHVSSFVKLFLYNKGNHIYMIRTSSLSSLPCLLIFILIFYYFYQYSQSSRIVSPSFIPSSLNIFSQRSVKSLSSLWLSFWPFSCPSKLRTSARDTPLSRLTFILFSYNLFFIYIFYSSANPACSLKFIFCLFISISDCLIHWASSDFMCWYFQ